jgi:hypothetical protein
VDAPSRREALATLRQGQDRVAELLAQLSDDQLVEPATIGGGDWSAKDLIGHIAAWAEVAVEALAEWRRGQMPWVERPDGPMSGSDQVDAFNARSVEEKRALGLGEVAQGAQASHRALVAAIEGMTEEEWRSKAWYPIPSGHERTLADLLGFLTAAPKRPFGHAFAHLPDLEAYARSAASR